MQPWINEITKTKFSLLKTQQINKNDKLLQHFSYCHGQNKNHDKSYIRNSKQLVFTYKEPCFSLNLTMVHPDISYFENSVDPYQLASKKPANQDTYCFPTALTNMAITEILQVNWIKLGRIVVHVYVHRNTCTQINNCFFWCLTSTVLPVKSDSDIMFYL